ncbi:MAG: hypothetical protein RJA44_2490, partial [Pseudomonadota bacterium]
VLVFIRTSPFRQRDEQYSGHITVPLGRPSADSARLIAATLRGLQRIYRPGLRYAKAGVMLLDLVPQTEQQAELWPAETPADVPERDRSALMATLDGLNQRYGRGTLRWAAAGTPSRPAGWGMKQERRTPQYTTDWQEMPVVRA